MLKLETSESNDTKEAELGDYVRQESGIDAKVIELAEQFEKIAKNRNFYTWTAFADDEKGTGISDNAYGKDYLGIATNRLTKEADLSDPTQYTWVKIKGEQGIPGVSGKDGADGKTPYFHVKYSAVANPTSYSDMTETPDKYIGTYVDYELDDSTDPKSTPGANSEETTEKMEQMEFRGRMARMAKPVMFILLMQPARTVNPDSRQQILSEKHTWDSM